MVTMHCYGKNATDNIVIHTLHLSEIQIIYTVDCLCDIIMADEYRIIVDLEACNGTYYFELDDLVIITACHGLYGSTSCCKSD